MRVAANSPLRDPPLPISERQIVLLDGIRYSADMAAIAIDRLWERLCFIDQNWEKATSADIAEAGLYAWSIVDAAHRLTELIRVLPGLRRGAWWRLFIQRTKHIEELRHSWQHQASQSSEIVTRRGQIWGSLGWVQHIGTRPTPNWFLAVIGSDLKGSEWIHVGPMKAIPRVGTRRIRLFYGATEVYLARVVRDLFEVIGEIEKQVGAGQLRLVGPAVSGARDRDWIASSVMQIVLAPQPLDPPPLK